MRKGLYLALMTQLGACAGTSDPAGDLYEAMTEQDVSLAAMLLQRTLDYAPDGITRRWSNDESGHSGAITPVRTYLDSTGQFCRDYLEQILVGGDSGQFMYSACRDEDGWET